MDVIGIFDLARCGKRAAFAIDALVLDGAFDGVGAFAKNALHPFVKEKARAVDELVDHARRQIVGQFAPLRRFGLERNGSAAIVLRR